MGYSYTINGKNYTQKPLVLGQIIPLFSILQNKDFTDLSPLALLMTFGESLPRCIAIALVPEGEEISARDLDAMEREFANYLSIDTALQIITDFFLCNPISLLSEKFRAMVSGVWSQLPKEARTTTKG